MTKGKQQTTRNQSTFHQLLLATSAHPQPIPEEWKMSQNVSHVSDQWSDRF